MAKQRGAHIPWVFAQCPMDLALRHLTERSSLSTPIQPSDLTGLEHLQGHYLVHGDEKQGCQNMHPIIELNMGFFVRVSEAFA